ncbi:hypothetical protein QTO34_006051 [Cnephaeus nilssonii]|uniref:Ferritin light chain n=1 Tax=Cnephaeus nilssonii TaxID=3371016 RepID=A0AA40HN29_CNENI|nr:hypothetical protein QTO34_006051 [Eptesicus nilssonii]
MVQTLSSRRQRRRELSVLLAQSATPATLSPAPCASCWPNRGRSGVMTMVPLAVPDLSLASTVFRRNRPRDTPSSSGGCGPPTPTSLGFYFTLDNVALKGVGHFFRELAEKKRRDLSTSNLCTRSYFSILILMQPCRVTLDIHQKVKVAKPGAEAFPRRVGKTQDAMEASTEPEPGPLGAAGPGSTHADPQLWDFRENHFLGEQVKLIKKMGHTWLTSEGWPGPQAGLGEYLFERLTLNHN